MDYDYRNDDRFTLDQLVPNASIVGESIIKINELHVNPPRKIRIGLIGAVDLVIASGLSLSRTEARSLIKSGCIRINYQHSITDHNRVYRINQPVILSTKKRIIRCHRFY